MGIYVSRDFKMLFNSLVSTIPNYRLTLNEIKCCAWMSQYDSSIEDTVKAEMYLIQMQLK